MLFRELEIDSKTYYFIKIILVLLIILILYKYFYGSNTEHFNLEASQNIDSVYNVDNLIVEDLVINQGFNMLPTGCVVAWTKDTIPKGWAICDGSNNTPDLRGRFIVGSGQGDKLTNRNIGDSGGEETHLLTENEIPEHGHDISIFGSFSPLYAINLSQPRCTNVINSGEAPFDESTTNQDKTQPHNNMPPFYILYYIMKL